MSAVVAHVPDRQSKLRYVVALVLMAAAMAAMPGAHAVRRHGAEAVAVRQCMDNSGPALVFRDKHFADKLYLLCQLEPDQDKWGLQIVRKAGRGWQEVTSFIPKNGTLARVVEYVSRSATFLPGGVP